ncbi:MAG TPA: 4-(cytidine 5'-diphospho)-2-C-methyl-D-erythritol kinase [Candidatus Blautia pullicola]|jgi:4-diphosphocytidyl-2-C-methyl-D-erythritol kinase|uniref:4-diphosphocytidyl-2-C-methyl-D-erythritol kinase n=1 Tax=Candidatus Blautia pullicola TaxID=2838498 RepID=A0A9D2FPJ6_9FIRM|nr:4-(cytidine 5'-diphospho)-2-C-methyl-D-erythritol kinase [Candidatus Blautia pullicola]
MRLRALAKINLGLDVLRRREDGYHELRMIMQTINMYDQLDMEISEERGIHITSNLPFIPTNENNLVYKAAKLLMDEFQVEQGLKVDLQKFIPVAAGMAGGSSDAAAAMIGVNRLFGLGLSVKELMKRGVKVGADVPYCLLRGTALAEGIGEKLRPLPPCPDCYVLIGKPGISVSTKFVYENLRANELKEHPPIDRMLEALQWHNLYKIADYMGNVLETVTIPKYPVIEEIKNHMKEHGALNAMMSGSGPTVFGLFDDKETAERACEELRASRLAKTVFLTTVFNNGGRRK